MKKTKHPMQPIEWSGSIIRFKQNNIIDWLHRCGKIDLNEIAALYYNKKHGFTRDDMTQLNQLLGYSVSGFGDLSFVDKNVVRAADDIAAKMVKP